MSRPGTALPKARTGKDLIVQDLADELVVYDAGQHRAHCLTPAASVVFRLCDGKTDEAAAIVALEAAGHANAGQLLDEALAALREAQLLEAAAAPQVQDKRPTRRTMPSRRDMLKRAALIAGAT